MSRVSAYVLTVSVLAAVAAGTLYVGHASYDPSLAQTAICFAALGFLGQMLAYSTGPAIGGSSAFLPFLTAAVLAPHWITCVAVAVATLGSAIFLRRPGLKTVFNIAS